MELFKEESQGDILKHSLMIGEDEERAEDNEKLEDYAPDQKIILKLEEMYKAGKLAQSDLDERAFEALKEFPVEDALEVLDQFFDSNLEHVSNKSAYLCAIMKAYRQKSRTGVSDTAPVTTSSLQSTPLKGPDEEKIKAIMDRTGYSLDVTFGQRKYGGPPPGWEGKPPISGCEVFCGKIPKDFYEDELIPLFEECGTIWDLRLMMDPMTGANRGYAFVTFTTREAAQSAVRKLDNHEIKPGVNLRINISVSNLRLFVGNIPKSKDKDEILEEFGKLTAGLTEVIIYSSPDDKKKNRGFCFLDYESHKAASLAKRKLGTGRIKVWGCDIIVDWADPQEEPDEEKMSTVKVLYVRNLTQEITEQKLKEEFEIYGKVERVKKIKDYAFIHFEDRERALRAMESLDSKKMGGANIEVTLAKPPSDKKKKEDILRARERRMMQMIHVRGGLLPRTQPAMRATPRYTESSMRLPGLGRGDYDYDYDFYSDNRVCYGEPYYDDFYQYNYYDYQPPTPLVRGRSRQVIDLDEAVFSGVYDFNSGIQIGRGRGVLGRVRSSGAINRGTLNTRSGWIGGAGSRGAPRQASRRGGRTKASLSVMLPVA